MRSPGNLFIFFSVILISFSQNLLAQINENEKETNHRKLILSPGISYQGQTMGELNLMYSKTEIDVCNGSAIWGPRIGIESNFSAGHFLYAPKTGYEVAVTFFALRGSMIGFVDNGNVDLRLLPEIGLSLFGTLNVMYGHQFPLLHFRAYEITRNRITLTLNLDFELWSKL